MVSKVCSRSHGQPVPGVRSAAMISMSRAMSREGVIAGIDERADDGGPYNACRQLSRILRHVPPSVPGRAKARPGCQLLLVAGSLGLAAGFEQEPAALFGFVDEILQKAGGRHVLVLVGDLVRRAPVVDLRLIVVPSPPHHSHP